jgi:hypothetical protein
MVPSQSDKTSVPDERSAPQANSASFSGYFFRVPDELIDRLGELSHAELKAYLVIQHAIQKDRGAGLLSTRQLLGRTGFKSMGHVERAAAGLRSSGWVTSSGGRRRTARYSNPFEFRAAKSTDCTPAAVQSRSTRTGDCTAPAVHNCTPAAVQPIESLKKNINLARSSSMEKTKTQKPTPPEMLALEKVCSEIRDVYPNSELAQSGPPNEQTLKNILQGIGGRTVDEFTAFVGRRFKTAESPYDRKGPKTWGLLVAWAREFGGSRPEPKPVAVSSSASTMDPDTARRIREAREKRQHADTCQGYGLDLDEFDKTVYVRMCETCMNAGRKLNRPRLIEQALEAHPGYRSWESMLAGAYGRSAVA